METQILGGQGERSRQRGEDIGDAKSILAIPSKTEHHYPCFFVLHFFLLRALRAFVVKNVFGCGQRLRYVIRDNGIGLWT